MSRRSSGGRWVAGSLVLSSMLGTLAGCNFFSSGVPHGQEVAGSTWSKSFGGPHDDRVMALTATRDGGFAFAGSADSQIDSTHRDGDLWFSKLDALGDLQQERLVGRQEVPVSMPGFGAATIMPDGGHIIVGSTLVAGTRDWDLLILRTDAAGDVVWTRTLDSGGWTNLEIYTGLGGRSRSSDYGIGVSPTPDGGAWIVADSAADVHDTSGAIGPAGRVYERAQSYFVVRIDAEGRVLATRRIADDVQVTGSGRRFNVPKIHALPDGGAVVGHTYNYPTKSDPYDTDYSNNSWLARVQRLAPDAGLLWTAEVQTADHPQFVDVIPTDDPSSPGRMRDGVAGDGFLVVTRGYNGKNSYVVKLSGRGAEQWTREYNTGESYPAMSLETAAQRCTGPRDCTYVLVGSRAEDEGEPWVGFISHLDENGQLIAEVTDPTVDGFDAVDGGDGTRPIALYAHAERPDYVSSIQTRAAADLQQLSNHEFDIENVFFYTPTIEGGQLLLVDTYQPKVLRYDSAAVLQKSYSLPTYQHLTEEARGIAEIGSGSFVVGGSTASYGNGLPEAWLLRYDVIDGIQWQRRIAPGSYGRVLSVAAGPDGGAAALVLAGGVTRVLAFDASGTQRWRSQPLGKGTSDAHGELVAVPGGFLVVEALSERLRHPTHADFPFDGSDVTSGRAALVTTSGTVAWAHAYHKFAPQSAAGDGKDGYVLAGTVNESSEPTVLWVDAHGQPQAMRRYLVRPGQFAGTVRVRRSADGNYLLATSVANLGSPINPDGAPPSVGGDDVLLFAIAKDGAPQWGRRYGGLYDEQVESLVALPDGGYAFAGSSESLGEHLEGWVVRVGPDGRVNGDLCNAFLGTFRPEEFAVQELELPTVIIPEQRADADKWAPTVSSTDTARESTDHVIARQCAGPASNSPGPLPQLPSSYPVSVAFLGDGTGRVLSSPSGLNCTAACSTSMASGQVVSLQAASDAHSRFAGWVDCPVTDGRECLVAVNASITVTARFERIRHVLEVFREGAGSGRVTSFPDGIGCGVDCTEPFLDGATVQLNAAAAVGSTFAGWINCPTPSGSLCDVRMDAARAIAATFESSDPNPLMTLQRVGSGTVTSTPAGIDCGATCAVHFAPGTVVTLTATAEAGWHFTGFGGDPDCADGEVTMGSDESCTATFVADTPPPPASSRVTVNYTATDYVTAMNASFVIRGATGGNVNCPIPGTSTASVVTGSCSAEVAVGTPIVVALTYDASRAAFAGWAVGGRSCDSARSSIAPGGRTDECLFDADSVDRTLTAQLSAASATQLLRVQMDASSRGTSSIVSSPVLVNCLSEFTAVAKSGGGACEYTVATGSTWTLLATPGSSSSSFGHWAGCDSQPATGECRVTMTTGRTLTLTITQP